MDKNILKQYADIQSEIKNLEKRIKNLETHTVTDSVQASGDFPYSQHNCVVEGVDNKQYYIFKKRLNRRKNKLEEIKGEILEFIDNIEDSKNRQIFMYKYLDNYSWIKIGILLKSTEEAVRKKHNRYLNKIFK